MPSNRKKVYLVDNPNFRTTRHWRDYLMANYDFVHDMYWNPVYAEWADVIWVEWCEGTAQEASMLKAHYTDVYDHAGIRGEVNKQYSGDFNWSGKEIYIRPIDIDIHYGHFRGVKWDNITGMAYIAPSFGEMLHTNMTYPATLKEKLTPLSIKVDEWTYRDRP